MKDNVIRPLPGIYYANLIHLDYNILILLQVPEVAVSHNHLAGKQTAIKFRFRCAEIYP